MDDPVLYLKTFRAYREYRALGPMTDEEWQLMKEMVPGCPMQGEEFDEINWLYPFKIPRNPVIHRLSETEEIFSVGVRFNHTQFVGVTGGMDLLESYNSNLEGFLFVVGKIKVKEKEGRTYYNIRPRGWLIASVLKEKQKKKQ